LKRQQHAHPKLSRRKSDSNSRYSSQNEYRYGRDDDDNGSLDDFIVNDDEEDQGTKAASKVIKRLYGHNKYSYADEEDYDDRQMEASFDQIAREEFISKKIGKKEDEIEYKRMLARGEVPDI